MKTILHSVDIQATADSVFAALTTESGLAGWWTATVEAQEAEGGLIAIRFGSMFNPDMKITTLKPGELVEWECVGGHDPWRDNTFRFEIVPRGDGCVLFFKQEYAQELSDEEYGRYNFNWGYYLESLRRLVETGRGSPYNAATMADRRAVVERFVEEYKNQQNPDIVDELIAEDCRIHIPLPGLPQGRQGMHLNGRLVWTAFPDVRVEREFFVAEGDIVVERAHATATHLGELMNTAPTGRPVTWTELHAYRVEDGRITEIWTEADFMGMMAQIGAVDVPTA